MPRIRVVDLLVSDDTAGEEGGIVVDEAEQGRTTADHDDIHQVATCCVWLHVSTIT